MFCLFKENYYTELFYINDWKILNEKDSLKELYLTDDYVNKYNLLDCFALDDTNYLHQMIPPTLKDIACGNYPMDTKMNETLWNRFYNYFYR